ncbi:MAG TPA: helix-turn-helix domain-containing protein [Verrucomicrobium sp.]|nr:helix-turn-helix domain-containing protein [Verrucomicrobium sp.]
MNDSDNPARGPAPGEPLLVNRQEACRILGIGSTTLYHLCQGGAIRSVLVKSHSSAGQGQGGRRLYVMASLREYVNRLLQEQASILT